MKRIKYITLVVLFVPIVILSSCKGFLEETNNPNYLSPDTFWKSEEDITKGLTAVYAATQPARYWGAAYDRFIVTDNYRSDELDYRPDVTEWNQIATFTNGLGNYVTEDEWTMCYRGISYANQCITNIPKIEGVDEAIVNRSMAEARFLRAYFYMRLYMNYGERLPLYTKQIEGTDEEFFPPQSEVGVIKNFIETELTEVQADGMLPDAGYWSAGFAGRATKYAAAGLLGRFYMFTHQLPKAKVELAKIVTSGEYSLVENYGELFDGLHKNSSESIFEIQFCGNRDGGKREHNQLAEHLSPGDLDGGYEEAYPSKWLFDTMKGDLTVDGKYSERMYGTILFNDPHTSYFLLPDGNDWEEYLPADAIYWHKYNTWDESLSSEWWYSAFNIYVLRYADVLLMYAECLNDEGSTTDAIDYINIVRDRSNLVPLESGMSKDAVLKHLQDVERPCELALEGIRWYDLIRWGNVAEALQNHNKPHCDNFQASKHTLYPIPHNEFLLNPDWEQNPNFPK